jgi:hypothetical protein
MQAERLDRVQTTLRGIENETEEANKAITWLLGYAVVNLVFFAGVIIRIAFYGGGQ